MIVIAVEEYARLCQAGKAGSPDLIEHLLAIPRAPDDDAFELPTRTGTSVPGKSFSDVPVGHPRGLKVRYSEPTGDPTLNPLA